MLSYHPVVVSLLPISCAYKKWYHSMRLANRKEDLFAILPFCLNVLSDCFFKAEEIASNETATAGWVNINSF